MSRATELIHDTLYVRGWGITFSLTFSIILDDTTLIQLSLSTITLQFLHPILVIMLKMTVLLLLFFSADYENAHLMMAR